MRLLFLLGVFALCANSGAFANPSTLTDSTAKIAPCKLDVGWTHWKPYQYFSDKNKAVGLTIELLDLIAKEMRCEFIYHQNDWLTSVQLIKSGKLDLICSASMNQQRHEFAFFSKPYYQELVVLYVRGNDKFGYRASSLLELFNNHDFKLGMLTGAKFDNQLTSLQSDPQFKEHFIFANSWKELFKMLNSGVIDGYFSDPLNMDSMIVDSNNGALIESYPLEIKTGPLHFMFSKNRIKPKRLVEFNKALAKVLKVNGSKFEWFLQEQKE